MKKFSFILNILLILIVTTISWPKISDFIKSESSDIKNIYQCGTVILSSEEEYGGLTVQWVTIPHADFKLKWNNGEESWDFSQKDGDNKWVIVDQFEKDITTTQAIDVECDGTQTDSKLIDTKTFNNPVRLPSIDENTTNIGRLGIQLKDVLPGFWNCQYMWNNSQEYDIYATGNIKVLCNLTYMEYHSAPLNKAVSVEAIGTSDKITGYDVSILEYISNPGSSGVCSGQEKSWFPFIYKTVYYGCGEDASTDVIKNPVYGEDANSVLQETENILGSLTYEGTWTWSTNEYDWKEGNWILDEGSLVPINK